MNEIKYDVSNLASRNTGAEVAEIAVRTARTWTARSASWETTAAGATATATPAGRASTAAGSAF